MEAMCLMGDLFIGLRPLRGADDIEGFTNVGNALIWYSEAAARGNQKAEGMVEQLKLVLPPALFDYYQSQANMSYNAERSSGGS